MPLANTFTVTIAATGVAQQLPNVPLVGQFLGSTLSTPANAATINVSSSAAGAASAATSFGMRASTQLPLAITNTNQLWIQGTAGDQLSFIGV